MKKTEGQLMHASEKSSLSIPCAVRKEHGITSRAAIVALIALIPGCGAKPDGVSQNEEPTATTSEAWSIVWSNYWPLQWVGGSGGQTDAPFHCPPNAVAVGVYGTTTYQHYSDPNNYIGSFGVLCETLNSDGTLATTATKTFGGGPWIGFYYQSQCPQGDVMVGLQGNSGTYVDSIAPMCEPLAYIYSGRYISPGAGAGGYGGSQFFRQCGEGWVVTNGVVRSGSWVDGLQLTCDYISPN